MDKVDDDARNKRMDELSLKAFELDDICSEIWLTLLAKKRLRPSEMHRSLKKFGTDISKPTLLKHLSHLVKQKLITRKVEGFQNVSYGLTEEIYSLLHVSQEDMAEWFEVFERKCARDLKPFDMKKHYAKVTEKQLDQETNRDLNDTLVLNLFELKAMISYDLKIDKDESDADFWKLIGNPFYRMHERTIAEKCRESDKYRRKLFEKIKILTRSRTLIWFLEALFTK